MVAEINLSLQSDCSIVVDENGPLLSREGVPVAHRLQVAEAVALTFLSITGDRKVAEAYCEDCLPGGKGSQWIHRVINRYWTYLGEGAPRPMNFEWIETLDLNRVSTRCDIHREAAPAAITWLVTLSCNRHCPYCFYTPIYHNMDRSDSPLDATFALSDVSRMVRKMSWIGAADLYLTGGEPLLRKDLLEVVQEASTFRVRTHLTTKYPLDRDLAKRLARAGLSSVTFSLDDARLHQAAALAGSPGYLSEAKRAITALLGAGIPVEINAVATTVNIPYFELLVKLAIHLGVPKLSVSPFIPPYPRWSKAARLISLASLEDLVRTMKERYGHQIILEARGSTSASELMTQTNNTQLGCDAGLKALAVLPDGGVSRCRYLPGHEELIVGSLEHQSLLEIWESSRLAALSNPDEYLYEGTKCVTCFSFDMCTKRGRCYFSALNNHGRLYAPDAFCPKLTDHETSPRF